MSILVVGSVAYDTIKTLHGARQKDLGGSATFFSIAASYFAPVSVVAVVGDDFTPENQQVFATHKIDTRGLAKVQGNTFHWIAEYSDDMNQAHTLDTQLNVLADFQPVLDPSDKAAPYLFLANIDPDLQHQVLQQMEERPKLVAGDTMNFWIQGKPNTLTRVINSLDTLLINDAELRLLSGEINVVKAAKHVLGLGPSTVIVKRGEFGAIGFTSEGAFIAPAYPLESVVDPTGAGDAFAGGLMGYLAASGDLSTTGLRLAMIIGSIMASFTVESFGVDRLSSLSIDDIRDRYREFWKLTYFDGSGNAELPTRDKLAGELSNRRIN